MITKPLRIESRAPTRVDLAGGTLDIWPIYLLLPSPSTINLAIDLYATSTILEQGGDGILLRSEDQGHELKCDWDTLMHVQAPPQLELHLKLLRSFHQERVARGESWQKTSFTLTTSAKSPAGAGLGGSSSLSVSLSGALAMWSRGRVDTIRDGDKLIEIVRDTETTVIQVPAGLQDYYGAMYGGLQELCWRAGTHQRQWFPDEVAFGLEERLLLFYSGQSRNSGINNWTLFKSFIDRQGQVREQFEAIRVATEHLRDALQRRDWEAVGQAIAEEWRTRRTLAPGISSSEMDRAFGMAEQLAQAPGKICGAGGGGCFFVYVQDADPTLKAKVVSSISQLGIRPLPFRVARGGLEIQVKSG